MSKDLCLALVFPTKEATFPNASEALAASVFRRAFFESELFAERIGERRLGMVEDFAQIKEVLL